MGGQSLRSLFPVISFQDIRHMWYQLRISCQIYVDLWFQPERLTLETDAAALAADIVGGQTTGLQQIAEVEGLALDDKTTLEIVAWAQTGVNRLHDLKLQATQIAHTALAVGSPAEEKFVVLGKHLLHIDMAADNGTARLPTVGRNGSNVGLVAAVANEAGEHVECTLPRITGAVEVSPHALQRVRTDIDAQTAVNTVAQ